MKAFSSRIVASVLALSSGAAMACNGVPPNVYAFFRDHLSFRVRIQKLGVDEAQALAIKYAKYLGMTLEESGGDSAKVARHGMERKSGNYSTTKDWTAGKEIRASVAELRANVDRFVPKADHQINFGILQLSPDMAAYDDESHDFVRRSLAQLQSMAKAPKMHRMLLDHCGSQHLLRASPKEIIAELQTVANCNPVLKTRLLNRGKKSETTEPIYNKESIRCFAKLTMLCPGLGLQIIGRYPKAHWGTLDAKPKCTGDLKASVAALFGAGSKSRKH